MEVIGRCNCRSDIHISRSSCYQKSKKGAGSSWIGSKGTNDLLYIDRAVTEEVKSRNKNLAMTWIDSKKLMISFHIRGL